MFRVEIRYLPAETSLELKHQSIEIVVNRHEAKSMPISYRMYKQDEEWKVIDIIVDSVSLIPTY